MKHFEVGKSYSTRSVCDHNCIITVRVAARSAHFITTTEGKRLKVTVSRYDGAETVKPWGSFSMCPVLSAKD